MSERGNAFFYVLIAVILLGTLTYVLSRSNDASPDAEISDAKTKAAVASILGYESQAKSAINRLMINGVDAGSIVFTLPSSASFNSTSTINNIFHPDGGGLQYEPLPSNAKTTLTTNLTPGYYIGRFNDFQSQTPTSAQDIVFTAYGVSNAVCAALNKKIDNGSLTPGFSGGPTAAIKFLVSTSVHGTGNSDMTASDCGSMCKPSYCFYSGTGGYGYYFSILAAR